jgi:peptidoglycan/LPS O-acetylase OafA/YrhL
MSTLLLSIERYSSVIMRKQMKSSSRFHLPELDIVRLLALLLVFMHHALSTFYDSNRAWVEDVGGACGSGMQLFFLLSAYLITELLLREREKTQTVHIGAFFVRRILRIWPLYFIFLGLCFAISKASHFTILTTPQFLAFIFLAGNWWAAFHGFVPTVAGPLWSISLEEQYYIVWPFISRVGERAIWGACAAFLVLANVTLWYLGMHRVFRPGVWCNSFVEFEFFALGGILALSLHGKRFAVPVWMRSVMFMIAGACIFVGHSQFQIVGDVPVGPSALIAGYALFATGVVLIFLGLFGATLPSASKPFIYLGKISYGLYVFHDLAIRIVYRLGQRIHIADALAVIMSFAMCVGFAAVSYKFIEMPFLLLKDRFTFIRSR